MCDEERRIAAQQAVDNREAVRIAVYGTRWGTIDLPEEDPDE